MEELLRRVETVTEKKKTHLKGKYDLARRLGFTGTESSILQSQKREVIIDLAIQRGLIPDTTDEKAQ